MGKQKILVSRAIFPEIIERLSAYFDVDANQEDTVLAEDAFAERLGDKHGALVIGNRVKASTLRGAPHLRVLANLGVGYDNLDLGALDHAGILATNTPDVLNETVADHAWALMMNAARRIGESERWLRSGAWKGSSYDQFLGWDVHGSTLGIVGMGRIGQAIARRARGFGMQVLYHNRSRLSADIEQALGASHVSKEDLLRRADHVILVLPYTPENRHAIGARELAHMKPTATLTHIARGGIVDDAALQAALSEGRIAAAALDVFENEPAFLPALRECPTLVMTPHTGSASGATRRAMARLAADNLIAGLGHGPDAGRPPTPINPGVMERW